MGGSEGHATFENMESKCSFTWRIRQGSEEALPLMPLNWQSISCGTWRRNGEGRRWTSILIKVKEGAIRYAFFVGTSFLDDAALEKHVEHMVMELIEEAERWDLEPQLNQQAYGG